MYLAVYNEGGPEGGGHDILGLFSSLQKADEAVQKYLAREHPNQKIELRDSGPDIYYDFVDRGEMHYEYIEVMLMNLDEELTY